jgi:methionine biosynthesis protein MetW
MPHREFDKTLGKVARLLSDKMDPALMTVGVEKMTEFLSRVGTSAPRQTGPDGRPMLRWQDELIGKQIPKRARVLDLGCGSGQLLAELIEKKQVNGQGVELDAEAVFQCVARGVPVLQTNLEHGLSGFGDQVFDYVILEETLQTLQRPVEVLREMLRVGRHGLVSFPNFAYWRVRMDLGVRGRMPVTEWLPHRWYDTPNIHLFTLQDFLDWAEDDGVQIVESWVLVEGQVRALGREDNLYAEEALVVIERNSEGGHG